ncbi:MAG: TIGR02466 family protein [Pseudomonadota bacterium]
MSHELFNAPSNEKKETVIQARWHFAVPVYDVMVPGYDEQSQSLLEAIGALRQRDEGTVRSNRGGWHSSDRLLHEKDPHIQWLIQQILKISTACINDFEKERVHGSPILTSAWANVNHTHQWNVPHQHLPSDWSGVFYAAVDEQVEETGGDCGQLMLFNPMPLGDRYRRESTVNYKPKTGLMLLFPSYLLHMVAPHTSSAERVTIAFNLRVPLTTEEIEIARQRAGQSS